MSTSSLHITHNAEGTRRRTARLRWYYSRHVLRGRDFICRHCEECVASHAGRFIPGQLNAPGGCFDLAVNGVPLRMMIVGQEVGGGEGRVSMARRKQRVMAVALERHYRREGDFPGRNQHMKGVTNALRLLFERGLGSDYEGEWLTFADGSRHHLFECFALVNYLLCSAISADPNARARRGESTATMRRNCNEHFRATLDILEPTVVVVEGKSFWKNVRRAFDHVEQIDEQGNLYAAQIGNQRTFIASLTHPSAMHPHNWGSNERMPYLLDVVAPTIRRLREELFSGANK